MEVFKAISPLKQYLKDIKFQGHKIGLVPTMGALHQGHISLAKASLRENDITVCTIYVNPAQFNNKSDLKKYPRDLNRDIEMLEVIGCQALFCPDDAVMYPNNPLLKFNFGSLETTMEGEHRPGHFNGVGLIVSKLFHIIQPDRAYFGQKDLQQFAIIKQLVSDLFFDIELRRMPIVRESDGLAMSSRNLRLNSNDRKKSVILYQALKHAEQMLRDNLSIEEVKNKVTGMIEEKGVELEYFDIVGTDDLQTVNQIYSQEIALCIAAFVGRVRLIDNLIIKR